MNRRAFISALGGAAAASCVSCCMSWPLPARAQQSGMLRVGTANVQARSAPQWAAFERRLAELGYVEGKNLAFDHIQIPGTDAWEASYRDLVARKADIIVAAGAEASLTAALAAADS